MGCELFEVVCEELSANVDSKHASMNEIGRDGVRLPFHGIPNDRSRNERDDVREAEARVYDQHAFWGWR